jgi:hypothetical protein
MKFWHAACVVALYAAFIASLDPWRVETWGWVSFSVVALIFGVASYHNDKSV